MTRQQAYSILYKELSIKDFVSINENTGKLRLENDDMVIELQKDNHYEYELFIANKEGFTTVDIAILYEEVEDYKWCWKWLKTIGITEDIFQC